jgi:hypothetical protein
MFWVGTFKKESRHAVREQDGQPSFPSSKQTGS